MEWEKRTQNEPKTNPIKANKMPKQTQTNPIYRGVASGEAGTKPISKGVSTREPDVAQLPVHGTFSANIEPGTTL